MTLGDRVAVLNDGVLQQVDTPQRLFRHPANLFVAAFIGSPSMNLVEARVERGTVAFAGVEIPAPDMLRPFEGRTVILGVRPSDLEDAGLRPAPGAPVLDVVPEVVEDLGTEMHAIFRIDAPPVVTDDTAAALEEEALAELDGEAVSDRATFTASLDPRSAAEPGRPLRLVIDPVACHFFDPETSRAIEASADRPAGEPEPEQVQPEGAEAP